MSEKIEISGFVGKPKVCDAIGEYVPLLFVANRGFEIGADKYGAFSWEKSNNEEKSSTLECCVDAAMRHLLLVQLESFYDEESGLSHMFHAACRLLMANTKYISYVLGTDEQDCLLGVNEYCVYLEYSDDTFGYIPPIFILSLMKVKNMKESNIVSYYKKEILEKYKEENFSKLNIATARYILSNLMHYKKETILRLDYLSKMTGYISMNERILLTSMTVVNEYLKYISR